MMSHIIGIHKKADSQKGVRKAKSLGNPGLIKCKPPPVLGKTLENCIPTSKLQNKEINRRHVRTKRCEFRTATAH